MTNVKESSALPVRRAGVETGVAPRGDQTSPTSTPAPAGVPAVSEAGAHRRTLTVRQQRIIAAIRDLTDEKGYAPSVREIGAAVDLRHPSSVAYQLGQLRDAGRVAFDPKVPRSVHLVEPVSAVAS